jgi:hypothetical protein
VGNGLFEGNVVVVEVGTVVVVVEVGTVVVVVEVGTVVVVDTTVVEVVSTTPADDVAGVVATKREASRTLNARAKIENPPKRKTRDGCVISTLRRRLKILGPISRGRCTRRETSFQRQSEPRSILMS